MSFSICSICACDITRLDALAAVKIHSTIASVAGNPRRSSQKITFERPDIGPTSISCSRPTRLAGTAAYTASISARYSFAVRREAGQIAIEVAHHHEIHEQDVDGGVAGALADAERGAVQARGAGLERRKSGSDPEPAVAVAVPVDPGLNPDLADQAFDEVH